MADVTPVLWQYTFSNFNEKARWALDYKGIAHERRSLTPGFPRAMAFSLRGTLPVLDLDGDRLGDTTEIVAALEARVPDPALYPADPIERARALELEDYFDEHAGHEMRRLLFWDIRDHPGRVARLTTVGKPRAAAIAMRAIYPVGWQYIKRRYAFSEEGAAAAADQIDVALDRIESERAGRLYLVGDDFSIADLCAAALLFPLAWPEQLPYDFPPVEFPALERFAGHPAVAWIAEIYARHRGTSRAINE